MPTKPKRPCMHPGCPNLTDGKYCPQHEGDALRESRAYDAQVRTEVEKRYNSAYWKKMRRSYLQAHPLCERCLKDGRYIKATIVHHILPVRSGGSDMPDNLMALCRACHEQIHVELGDKGHNEGDSTIKYDYPPNIKL